MRTPNTKCVICEKPLYRRPKDLKRFDFVACRDHASQARKLYGMNERQKAALEKGRVKGTNNLEGVPKSEECKRKMSQSQKEYCRNNPDKVKARGMKTRGANHYNWKGGCSRLSQSVRLCSEMVIWRRKILDRDGACLQCDSDYELQAHHIKSPITIINDNELRTMEEARNCDELWDLANGVTLCKKCHCNVHGIKYTPLGHGKKKQPKKKRTAPKGSNHPFWKGGPATLYCEICGTPFQVKPSQTNIRKYCSRKCMGISERKSDSIRAKQGKYNEN